MKLSKQSRLVYDFLIKKIDIINEENTILRKKLLDRNLELSMLKATFDGFMHGLKKKKK